MSRPMKQALITLLLLGTAFSQSGRIVRHALGGGHKIEVQQAAFLSGKLIGSMIPMSMAPNTKPLITPSRTFDIFHL
jgi:hypothetical protein